MELKYEKMKESGKESNVLIAPLWNWNELKSDNMNQFLGSNRTFMELK